MDGLTARALADDIGYTPGTIYNIYKNMDAVVLDINFATIGSLFDYCDTQTANLPADTGKVKALAYAYVDFAHQYTRAWETVFAVPASGTHHPLPEAYEARLGALFTLIETTLMECLPISMRTARSSARLLWACLHGITVLTLDGRLKRLGADHPHKMIDELLHNYLSGFEESGG